MARLRKSFFSIIPILTIFILVFIFFWPNLAQPGVAVTPTVGTNDLTEQQLPFRFYLSQSLKEKKIPLWSSRISGGFPLLAEGQMGSFYPLNLFLAFLPTIWAVNLNLILSFSLTSLFTYFYLVKIGLTRLSSLFGASVFCFSGFLVSHQVNLNILNVVTWLPLQCFLLEKAIRGFRVLGLGSRVKTVKGTGALNHNRYTLLPMLLLSLTFALQFLAGHPEVAFYIFFFLLGYVLLRGIRFLPLLLLVVVLGFFLAAFQIFPTLELVRHSPRAYGLDPDSFQVNFSPRELISFILPFFFWNPEISSSAFDQNGWLFYERYGYVGILPLALVLLTIIWWLSNLRRTLKREVGSESLEIGEEVRSQKFELVGFFIFALTVSLFLSFGNETPLGFLFNIFPFSLFRVPTRFLLIVDFSLACLAALGFEKLGSRGCRRRSIALATERGLGVRVKNFLSKKSTSYTLYPIPYTLIFIVFLDLFLHSRRLYRVIPVREWYQTPRVVNYFQKYAPHARIAHESYYFPRKKTFLEGKNLPQTLINLRNLLPGFNNLLYDLDVVTVAADYAGLKVAYFNEMEADLVFNLPVYFSLDRVDLPNDYFRLARLVGVTHLIFAKELVGEEVEKVYSVGFKNSQNPINIYRLKNTLPRAFVVYNADFHFSDSTVKRKIIEGPFDPQKTVLISTTRPDLSERPVLSEGRFGKANVVQGRETLVEVAVEAENRGFLVLLNSFYPGWKASVDGKETDIFRANYAFLAIPVSKGHHRVTFSYQPKSLRLGAVTSGGSGLIFLAGLLFLQRRSKNHQS